MDTQLAEALWKIYHRPERPDPWTAGSDTFWRDPHLSERILRQHLDDSHGAASRDSSERAAQIDWLWSQLSLQSNMRLFDVTCGPGLYAVEFARRGCAITGVDFSPPSIAYARDLAMMEQVSKRCTFVEQDIRQMDYAGANFDAAMLLYGQLAVFQPDEAQAILRRIAQALKPGGRLCLELLDQVQVDKTDSTWWFTDNSGLWDDSPFLHLGERFWHPDKEASIERYQIVHLETGRLTTVHISDQTYAVETVIEMLRQAGFDAVEVYPAWGGLPLADAEEWVVYVAVRRL